jgi:hypothetical protein
LLVLNLRDVKVNFIRAKYVQKMFVKIVADPSPARLHELLCNACAEDSVVEALRLLVLGAKPSLSCVSRHPLSIAAAIGSSALCELLFLHGANPFADVTLPSQLAGQAGHIELERSLLLHEQNRNDQLSIPDKSPPSPTFDDASDAESLSKSFR